MEQPISASIRFAQRSTSCERKRARLEGGETSPSGSWSRRGGTGTCVAPEHQFQGFCGLGWRCAPPCHRRDDYAGLPTTSSGQSPWSVGAGERACVGELMLRRVMAMLASDAEHRRPRTAQGAARAKLLQSRAAQRPVPGDAKSRREQVLILRPECLEPGQ